MPMPLPGAVAQDSPLTVHPPGRALAMAVMVASGFAGLGYQIVWTQQCALLLGHEAASVLAVVTAFFGGLALGAWALGQRIARSPRPGRWYAACEFVIAAWALLLLGLMQPLGSAAEWLLGAQPTPLRQWPVTFAGTLLLLLPATAAMGATLPAMERIVSSLRRPGESVAALYAANTFGALLGVIATAFWLVPAIGLTWTVWACAGLNLGCATLALLRLSAPRPLEEGIVSGPRGDAGLGTLFATGLLGIGYEVLVVRVISQVAEDTVYTFAMLLAVYLVGTAAGAAACSRWSALQPDAARLRRILLLALCASCLIGSGSLWLAETVRDGTQHALGDSFGAALGAEAVLALLAFVLPTVVMGALFSHLGTQARICGVGLGPSLGINTLGGALAPLLFGVVLVPAAGAKLALLGVAAGYLALAWSRATARGPRLAFWGLLATVAATAVFAPPLLFIDVPEGGRVLSYREGVLAAVSVVEDADGVARLRINNRQQEGSSGTLLADARQALLPMLLHPDPRRALFLGLGTGLTAGSAAQDPSLQVDAAELLPEVIEASALFTKAFGEPAPAPRLHIINADARRWVRGEGPRYDLIIADNFHPARSGSGALYTTEHFQAVRKRLTANGLFCQWLPLHQLDLDSLRSIVRSYITVYPGAWAVLATNSLQTPVLGLVARADGQRFDPAQVQQRLQRNRMPQQLGEYGLVDELSVLGSFIAGPASLNQFAEGAALNTDDRPVVAYRAPRITYAPDSTPADRLQALLSQWRADPAEVIAAGPDRAADESSRRRLAAYWRARDRFLAIGRGVRPSGDVRVMLAQIGQPLLSVLAISPDFRPAYDPLLSMAQALSDSDPVAARALLTRLNEMQPSRPEAAQALLQLQPAVKP